MSSATRRARKTAAELAAALTLLFTLVSTVGFYEPSLVAYTGRGYGLLAIILSVAAFALSLRIRSPVVAGMLVSGGVLMQVPPVQAIVAAGMIAVPGPVLGVMSFAIILVLGLIKAIGSRAREVEGAGASDQAATGPAIPEAARLLATMLPDLLAFAQTSASAVIVYLLAFSRLVVPETRRLRSRKTTLATRIRAGGVA